MGEPIKIIVTQGSAGTAGAKGNPTVSGYSGPSVRGGEMAFGGELKYLNAQMRAQNIAQAKKNFGLAMTVAGAATSVTLKAINGSLDVMSDLTGNYITQRRFNETMNMVSTGANYAKTIGGFTMAGMAVGATSVGAVAGLAVAYYGVMINSMVTIGKKSVTIINTNMQAEMLRGQSGNGNGSRGTND